MPHDKVKAGELGKVALDSSNNKILDVKVWVHPKPSTKLFFGLGHHNRISTIAMMGTEQYGIFPTPPLQRVLRFSPKTLAYATFGLIPSTRHGSRPRKFCTGHMADKYMKCVEC